MGAVSRDYPREFKVDAVERVLSGRSIGLVAREIGVHRHNVANWRAKYLAGGPEALRRRGGYSRRVKQGLPSGTAPVAPGSPSLDPLARVAELERKIGQQQLELDFFEKALRHMQEARQRNESAGATASTPSSRR